MKSPAYQLYPDKVLADTRRLSWKTKGIYRDLRDVIWSQFQETCSIPDDNKYISSELGCSLEEWLEAKIEIMWDHRPLFDLKNGRLISADLLQEKLKQAAHRQKQAENGRKGGRPKESKYKKKKAVGYSGETQAEPKKSLSSSFVSSSVKRDIAPAASIPSDFIEELKANPAYKHVPWEIEFGKMRAWRLIPKNQNRKFTKAFVLNWINKIDRPLDLSKTSAVSKCSVSTCAKPVSGSWGNRPLCSAHFGPEQATDPPNREQLKRELGINETLEKL